MTRAKKLKEPCPHCGRMIKIWSTTCPKCGKRIGGNQRTEGNQ